MVLGPQNATAPHGTPRTPAGPSALQRLAHWCATHCRPVLAGAALFLLLCGAMAADASQRWSQGGYTASGTEAAAAERTAARFDAAPADLLFYVRADRSVDAAGIAARGRRLTETVARSSGVASATSYWSTGSPALRSRDGRGALIRVDLAGDESTAARTSEVLVPDVRAAAGDLRLTATGPAWFNAQATEQAQRDLVRCELLVLPLTALILLFAFGSVAAMLVPVVIGLLAVTGTLAVLSVLTHVMPISVFATNICASLGFGIAVDYCLLVITRCREETSRGATTAEALERSMATAGRAVLYSAVTVVLCLSSLLVLPLELLRSLACASMLVVLIAALSTVVVLPALLTLIGGRLDRWDPLHRLRRRRSTATTDSPAWRKIATRVTGRPVLWGAACTLLLLTFALPFAHAQFSLIDEKIMPPGSEAHRTARLLGTDFAVPPDRQFVVALPHTDPARGAQALHDYARRLSELPSMARVTTVSEGYEQGRPIPSAPPGKAAVPPQDPTGTPAKKPAARPAAPTGTIVELVSSADSNAPETAELLRRVRALSAPEPPHVAGTAARQTDTMDALASALPYALGIMIVSTALVLYRFTRSVLVPVKAIITALLSLTASLGALVHVFQDGHRWFVAGDFTVDGTLETTMPILAVAVAFGLSVDYEVFLLARIREEYDRTGDTTGSIVFGIARTGRLFTAAALVVATTTAALTLSDVTLLKMLGVGIAMAVLIDATLVRGIVVPAFMQLAGRANWWKPSFSNTD